MIGLGIAAVTFIVVKIVKVKKAKQMIA